MTIRYRGDVTAQMRVLHGGKIFGIVAVAGQQGHAAGAYVPGGELCNDVTVDIPIEDIRAGVRARSIPRWEGSRAGLRKGQGDHGVPGQNRSCGVPSGYTAPSTRTVATIYVKAPHSHLQEFGHARVTKDGKSFEHRVPGKFFSARPKRRPPHGGRNLRGMLGDAHFGKRR